MAAIEVTQRITAAMVWGSSKSSNAMIVRGQVMRCSQVMYGFVQR